jgi:hypothetical protein
VDRQRGPEIEFPGRHRQICKEEVKSHDQDEIIAAESKTETGTDELDADEWDADETLVEDQDQTPGSLEKTALKIVDGFYDEISTEKASGGLTDLDRLKVLKSEAPPAVKVVSQA